MPDLFTTGGISLDNIVAADGAVHLETLGGNAVYSAAGARLWSQRVGCVGRLPRNFPFSELDGLRSAGIDLSGVQPVDEEVDSPEWFFHREDGSRVDGVHAPSRELVAFGLSGPRIAPADARRFEAYLRTGGDRAKGGFGAFRSAHPVEPHHVPDAYWSAARGLHAASNRLDAQRRLVREALEHGLIVSLDPGRQTMVIADQDLDAMLGACDVFLPSEKELAVLAPGLRPEEAVRRLAERGRAIVAAKLGAMGSLVCESPSHRLLHIPTVPVAAHDPTGAGDAFAGGFLAAYVATRDPILAACCGTVSASFAVEDFGPYRLLAAGRAEAARRLARLVAAVPAACRLDDVMHLLERASS